MYADGANKEPHLYMLLGYITHSWNISTFISIINQFHHCCSELTGTLPRTNDANTHIKPAEAFKNAANSLNITGKTSYALLTWLHKNPVFPFRTVSRGPPLLTAITGTFKNIA